MILSGSDNFTCATFIAMQYSQSDKAAVDLCCVLQMQCVPTPSCFDPGPVTSLVGLYQLAVHRIELCIELRTVAVLQVAKVGRSITASAKAFKLPLLGSHMARATSIKSHLITGKVTANLSQFETRIKRRLRPTDVPTCASFIRAGFLIFHGQQSLRCMVYRSSYRGVIRLGPSVGIKQSHSTAAASHSENYRRHFLKLDGN